MLLVFNMLTFLRYCLGCYYICRVTVQLLSLLCFDVDSSPGINITTALVERLVAEFLALKHATNSVDLQLYEANEKIAELVEHVSNSKKEALANDFVFCFSFIKSLK